MVEPKCVIQQEYYLGVTYDAAAKFGPIGDPAQGTNKTFIPGPIGVISRSGGFTGELSNTLTHSGLGQSTSVSMGGDPIVGSTFVDLLLLFEADPETRAVVIFGEPGGNLEAELVNWVLHRETRLYLVNTFGTI